MNMSVKLRILPQITRHLFKRMSSKRVGFRPIVLIHGGWIKIACYGSRFLPRVIHFPPYVMEHGVKGMKAMEIACFASRLLLGTSGDFPTMYFFTG